MLPSSLAMMKAMTMLLALSSLATASQQLQDCPTCFDFGVDWASGTAATSFPTMGFGVRKVEAFVYPPDGKMYAYADIVNYTCATWPKCNPGEYYYPDSYSTEVGVFSSPNGKTDWQYHGIVVSRGVKGSWDAGGIASPGAAVAADGSVLLGYAAENSPAGGINRGIGMARAAHPLGPFTKDPEPIASPKTICGGTYRCDDVVMQTRPDGVHLYHSVKGPAQLSGIRHRMTRNNGNTWSNSTMVLSAAMQPGTEPAESIAGKYFPEVLSGAGGMVLITDGAPGGGGLHAYISKTPGSMVDFVHAAKPSLDTHPLGGPAAPGRWANLQITFFPDIDDKVVSVGYTIWGSNAIKSRRAPAYGMTMTVYALTNISTHSLFV